MTLKFKKVNGNILFGGYVGLPPESDTASQLLTSTIQEYREISLNWNLEEEVRSEKLEAIRNQLEKMGYRILLEEDEEKDD